MGDTSTFDIRSALYGTSYLSGYGPQYPGLGGVVLVLVSRYTSTLLILSSNSVTLDMAWREMLPIPCTADELTLFTVLVYS